MATIATPDPLLLEICGYCATRSSVFPGKAGLVERGPPANALPTSPPNPGVGTPRDLGNHKTRNAPYLHQANLRMVIHESSDVSISANLKSINSMIVPKMASSYLSDASPSISQ